jgi:hypothetical protein
VADKKTPLEELENRWILPIGIAGGIFVVIIMIGLLFTLITSSSLVNANKQADTSGAKTILKTAIAAATQYGVDNGDIYTEMKAGDLKAIESTIDWIDGDPGPGQVGILDTGEQTYTFAYLDTDGNTFHAARNDQGTVKYTTADGNTF